MIFFYAVLMVAFSQPSYTGSESSGNVTVTLLLQGGSSAVNITVTVMPFDQPLPSATAMGKKCIVISNSHRIVSGE